MTGRTDAPLFTGERHEELMAAVGAPYAGESLPGVAAPQVIQDCRADHRTPKPVSGLKALGIDPLELLVVFLNQPVQRRIPRLARTIERGILTVDNAHREPSKRHSQ